MEYKILSNGKEFLLKIKKGLFWNYEKKYFLTGSVHYPVGASIKHFKSEKSIIDYVKKKYGTHAKRIRKYRII